MATELQEAYRQPRSVKDVIIELLLLTGVMVAIWYLFFLVTRWMGFPELAMAFGIIGLVYVVVKRIHSILPEELRESSRGQIRFGTVSFIVMTIVVAKTFPTFIVPNALAAEVSLQQLHQDLHEYAGAKLRVRGLVTDFRQGMRNPFDPDRSAMSAVTLEDGKASIEMHYDHDLDEMVPNIGDHVLVTGVVAMPKRGKMDLVYQAKYGRPTGRFLATDMKLVQQGKPSTTPGD